MSQGRPPPGADGDANASEIARALELIENKRRIKALTKGMADLELEDLDILIR